MSFTYIYNCPECFWRYHQGDEWQQSICVSKKTRIRLCSELGLTHVRVPDDYTGSQIVGLGEPPEMGCKSELALGSGLCWFSTIYNLLVGKKAVSPIN